MASAPPVYRGEGARQMGSSVNRQRAGARFLGCRRAARPRFGRRRWPTQPCPHPADNFLRVPGGHHSQAESEREADMAVDRITSTATAARISRNVSVPRQTPKTDFGTRLKEGLETAAGAMAAGAAVAAPFAPGAA